MNGLEAVIRTFKTVISADEEQMGLQSSADLVSLLEHYTRKQRVPVLLNLAAAPSMDASYAATTAKENLDKVDWSLISMIHLDEYFSLPADHPNTFMAYLKQHFTGKIGLLRDDQIHFIKDMQISQSSRSKMTVEVLAAEYGNLMSREIAKIKAAGGAYIGHIGIGENCHLAFNEWYIPKDTREFMVPVNIDLRSAKQQLNDYQANPDPKARYTNLDEVPRLAVTATLNSILCADHLIVVVPGEHKAEAVYEAIDGPLNDRRAGSYLRTAKDVRLFVTKASASWLHQTPEVR